MSTSMILKVSLGDDLRRIPVQAPASFSFTDLGATFRSMFTDNLPQDFAVQYVDDEGDTIVVSSNAELQEAFRVAVDDKRKSLRFTIVENPSVGAPAAKSEPDAKLDVPTLLNTLQSIAPAFVPAPAPKIADPVPVIAPVPVAIPALVSEEEEEGPVVHRRVVCDGCDASPSNKQASINAGTIKPNGVILGIRYKSAVTQDYDLCATCEDSGEFEETHAPFLKINHPSKALSAIFAVVDENSGRGANHHNWRKHGGRRGGRHGGGGGCGRRNRWTQQQQMQQTSITACHANHP
jgi:hypothetical protein